MPLTSEQQEKIRNWLIQKNANQKCPMCQKNQWAFGEIITSSLVDDKGKTVNGKVSPAMVQIVWHKLRLLKTALNS